MIRFEKVSYEQYKADIFHPEIQTEDENQTEYEHIRLPARSTRCSAGYDFFAPRRIILLPGDSLTVHTGIRVILEENMFLGLYPRSGLGFKYQMGLANTVGIVDADYCQAKNEGHIAIKLVNRGNDALDIPAGKAFAQGIIQKYYITDDDSASGLREGGFGSTDQ